MLFSMIDFFHGERKTHASTSCNKNKGGGAAQYSRTAGRDCRYPGSVTHNAPHIGTVEWHIRWSLALP